MESEEEKEWWNSQWSEGEKEGLALLSKWRPPS
jgi:hypothetical protein